MAIRSRKFRKPLTAYTREELDDFKRSSRDLQWALKEVAPYFRARDQRSFRHWVFTAGWRACLDYYEELLIDIIRALKEANEKALEKELARWEKRTKLDLLGEGEEE